MAFRIGQGTHAIEIATMIQQRTASRQQLLVAEDDRTTRYAITTMLRNAGYAVSAAKDGTEALRKIQKKSFDLVFLDIWMPGMSGLEVLARLPAGAARPKVIIMTSDGTPESLLRAVREQAYEYFSLSLIHI